MSFPLLERLPPKADVSPDTLLEGFLDYASEIGLELYPAQEEAILEIFSGNHVILATPTGSGKSLVALAAHYRSIARGEVSFYTAPIKALVSEKFFDLCRVFGPDHVGMMTGDASVNTDAPIICCTAEILAHLALRQGERTDVSLVIMDEFHYYADRDRGVAWQIPLLALPQCTFLLMSATLGNTSFFQEALTERGGRPTALVKSADRPVPLDYEYRETPLHETIEGLLEDGRVPVYIVHFTQRGAAEQAQNLMSVDFLSKEEKQAIKAELAGFRFDSPQGKELKRFVHHGVGLHHAGLLPKYRRMIEKLAQKGHLKLICGTDTLGVGVNVPIRAVLLTQLYKYDGVSTRVLKVREFQQVAGRAGRRGYDTAGSVVAQAPEHSVENRSLERKAAGDPKKLRKLKRRKPPERGYAAYDEGTFKRLIEGEPERLTSSFEVSHAMLLHMLERRGNGCQALKELIRGSHESKKQKRVHGRRAIALFRSLLEAEVIEILDEADDHGRYVQVHGDLQKDFSLNHALSLYVVEALEVLDPADPDYAVDVLTFVEATLETPRVVVMKQVDKLKTAAVNEMKANRVEYDERMAALEKIEAPQPKRELLWETFDAYRKHHPWVGDNVRPKSIARDMYEMAASFSVYVKEYGLARSEGVLLRYLTDAYKALVQTVPDSAKTDDVRDLEDWLGAVVRQVDSSLIDEWERMRHPEEAQEATGAPPEEEKTDDITANARAFELLIRNEAFRFIRHIALRQPERAISALDQPIDDRWTTERIDEALGPYFEEHETIRLDQEARSKKNVLVTSGPAGWSVEQILLDPEDHRDYRAVFFVDRELSREEQRPVMRLDSLGAA